MEPKTHEALQTLPTVVLIGRTNTGKTTLFNRLTGMRSPLVSDIPGTTRDWREAVAEWNGVRYRVIDTGGIDRPRVRTRKKGDVATVEEEVQRHAWKQMVNADLILLLVDGKADLSPGDRLWAEQVRKRNLPAIAVVNKVDAPKNREIVQEFWSLGLGTPVAISAVTGMGVGDLLEIVLKKITHGAAGGGVMPSERSEGPSAESARALAADDARVGRQGRGPHSELVEEWGSGDEEGTPRQDPLQSKPIRIAIIGKPNVGKSSLLNAILGEDRAIVSPIAGTTREPIDSHLTADGQDFVLVDTAGIRRKWKNTERLELAGVTRSKGVLRRTDVALLVLESQDPLTSQDLRLAEILVEANVGVIIIANKWDLFQESETRMMGFEVRKEQELAGQYAAYIRDQMPHLAWAPILYVSAKTSRNADEILAAVQTVQQERTKNLSTEQLEQWMKKMTYRQDKTGKTKKPYIYGITQSDTEPPRFQLTTEYTKVPTKRAGIQKGTVRDSYIRFLENRLRDSFGFSGTPIIVDVKTIKRR